MTDTDKLTWNCEMEVNLFHALRGHKPVGVNRHFQMLFIHDKLTTSIKKVTTKQIWAYLSELYDLQALNESEIVPFPNKVIDFLLPDNDFSDMMQKGYPRFSNSKQDESKSEKDTKSDKQTDKPDKHEKSDSGSTKSSKSESRHSLGAMATPDNSPKRKRTRNTPSNASPATPDMPATKRRR